MKALRCEKCDRLINKHFEACPKCYRHFSMGSESVFIPRKRKAKERSDGKTQKET